MKLATGLAVGVAACAVSGCATTLASYKPADNQIVMYNQGVGTVTDDERDFSLIMYPTFKYQSPAERPTFTLVVQDRGTRPIDFDPAGIRAFFDGRECHVYSLEERIGEIRRTARRKQIALAIVGGLAAGAAGYAAAHSTTTYSGYGYDGYHSFYTSGTIQTYDPAAGILAGAAVGATTGIGIRQIQNAAGFQEQAAQGIFQHTTVTPGSTVVGQIMLKPDSTASGTLRLEVPIRGQIMTFAFIKSTASY
jgi:hypothetical protein